MRPDWSTISRIRDNFRSFFEQNLECELCLEPSTSTTGICRACTNDLPFSGLCCPQCSEPVITEGRCGNCQQQPPTYDYSHCSLYYQPPLTHWITRCKDHRDARQISRLIDLFLTSPPLLPVAPDIIVSIPSHPLRLAQRGFNLSAELAQAAGQYLNCDVHHRALIKHRRSEHRGQNAQQRKAIHSLHANLPIPEGCHALLVDDVMTTGSTLDEAAAILKSQGAAIVGAWCLARTLKT
ncbi:MAG: ComF family protein [Pseudomonadota bacterium]|nr:ComF family protein [Pseudomonadota bacterium]